MGIRTPEQYKESLRDGRRVYIRGEKVEDITKHRILGITCDTIAAGYELTASTEPGGAGPFRGAPPRRPGNRSTAISSRPETAEDLANRTKMIQRSIKLIGGLPFGKDIGTDCLNAAFVVAGQMGKKQYQENAMNFLEHLRKNDLAHVRRRDLRQGGPVQGAGQAEASRLLPPRGGQEQGRHLRQRGEDPHHQRPGGQRDHRRSHPPDARERGRLRRELCRFRPTPRGSPSSAAAAAGTWSDSEFHADRPVRELTEAMIVFDNVFVPWDRVFMCGEWQYSMLLAYTFATFHRFTAISYKVPAVEVMAGCAVAMAKIQRPVQGGPHPGQAGGYRRLRGDPPRPGQRGGQRPGHARGHRRSQSPDRQHGQAPFRQQVPRVRRS